MGLWWAGCWGDDCSVLTDPHIREWPGTPEAGQRRRRGREDTTHNRGVRLNRRGQEGNGNMQNMDYNLNHHCLERTLLITLYFVSPTPNPRIVPCCDLRGECLTSLVCAWYQSGYEAVTDLLHWLQYTLGEGRPFRSLDIYWQLSFSFSENFRTLSCHQQSLPNMMLRP